MNSSFSRPPRHTSLLREMIELGVRGIGQRLCKFSCSKATSRVYYPCVLSHSMSSDPVGSILLQQYLFYDVKSITRLSCFCLSKGYRSIFSSLQEETGSYFYT